MIEESSRHEGVAHSRGTRDVRLGRISFWLSVAALLLSAALVVPYLASPTAAFVPLFVLAFAGGIVGLVLARRASRAVDAAASKRAGGWALVSSVVALVIDAILAVVFVVGLVAVSSVNRVELHGQGPDNITATISNDLENTTVLWPSNGRARFNTKGTWAELTVTAPTGSATKTVSCQILWNDEVVVDKKSDSGTVTCRYDKK